MRSPSTLRAVAGLGLILSFGAPARAADSAPAAPPVGPAAPPVGPAAPPASSPVAPPAASPAAGTAGTATPAAPSSVANGAPPAALTNYPTCTGAPTEMEQKGAQGAFVAGQGSFNEADYATAIMYWKDAYRRDCTAHAMLLNLARAFELKGEKAEAIHALETYLQRRPDDPTADQIQRRIQNLKSQIAAEAPPSPPPTAPQASPSAAAAATASSASPSPVEDTTRAEGKRSIVPWIVAGTGGALAIVGVAVYAGGKSKIKDVETKCGGRVCASTVPDAKALEQRGNDGVRQANIGGALAWTGAAAVAAGLVWHFAFDKPSHPAAAAPTALTPVLGHGFAGLTLDTSF